MFYKQNLFSIVLQRETPYGCHTKHWPNGNKPHKAWQRYMRTHEGSDYQEYAKAMNETMKALREYEKDIAKI